MAGFKISANQDIQGLFKSAEKAAVLEDNNDNNNNTVNNPPNNHYDNNDNTENNENIEQYASNSDSNVSKEDNAPLVPIVNPAILIPHTPTIDNAPSEQVNHHENIKHDIGKTIVDTGPLLIGKNKLDYEPFEPVISSNENEVQNVVIGRGGGIDDIMHDSPSAHGNQSSQGNHGEHVGNNVSSNNENERVVTTEIVSIVPKHTIRKIITVSDCVNGLDEDSLVFVSKLLTKKDYPGENVDLIFNIVNTKEKNVEDVNTLQRVLAKSDRVERVFELLELDVPDLVSVGEIVSLLTGEDITGNDQKNRARSLELAIQNLSVKSKDLLNNNAEIVSKIMTVL